MKDKFENIDLNQYSGFINAVIAAALGLAVVYTQMNLFFAAGIFLLFPYITLWVAEGWQWCLLSFVLTVGGGFYLFGLPIIISTMPIIIIAAPIIAILISRESNYFREIFIPAMVISALLIGLIMLEAHFANIDIQKTISVAMEEYVRSSIKEFSGRFSQSELVLAELSIKAMLNKMIKLLPAMIFIYSWVFVWVSGLISRFVLNRTGNDIKVKSISEFKISKEFAMALLVGIITYLGIELLTEITIDSVYTNFFVIFCSIFAFNGLAALRVVLRRKIPILIQFGIIFLLIYLNLFLDAVIIFGIIDSISGFREKITGEKA